MPEGVRCPRESMPEVFRCPSESVPGDFMRSSESVPTGFMRPSESMLDVSSSMNAPPFTMFFELINVQIKRKLYS